jgi:hypothetical protein
MNTSNPKLGVLSVLNGHSQRDTISAIYIVTTTLSHRRHLPTEWMNNLGLGYAGITSNRVGKKLATEILDAIIIEQNCKISELEDKAAARYITLLAECALETVHESQPFDYKRGSKLLQRMRESNIYSYTSPD